MYESSYIRQNYVITEYRVTFFFLEEYKFDNILIVSKHFIIKKRFVGVNNSAELYSPLKVLVQFQWILNVVFKFYPF